MQAKTWVSWRLLQPWRRYRVETEREREKRRRCMREERLSEDGIVSQPTAAMLFFFSFCTFQMLNCCQVPGRLQLLIPQRLDQSGCGVGLWGSAVCLEEVVSVSAAVPAGLVAQAPVPAPKQPVEPLKRYRPSPYRYVALAVEAPALAPCTCMCACAPLGFFFLGPEARGPGKRIW
jgi:hypothetical protein